MENIYGYRYSYLHKKLRTARNLLTLWNEHRITEEEFIGIEEMIKSTDDQDILVADSVIRALCHTRAKLSLYRVSKSKIKKMKAAVYICITDNLPLKG